MSNKSVRWIIAIVSVLFVASIGSVVMGEESLEWYQPLKPSFAPPDWLFGPVWTWLYILIAISMGLVLVKSNFKNLSKVYWSYGINLGANALWPLLFFGIRNPILAFVDIIIVWISIVWMMNVSYRIDKKSMYLLVPYLLWVSFAMVLNFAIAF